MRPVRDLAQMEYLAAITNVIEVVLEKSKTDETLKTLVDKLIDVSAYVSYLELERRAYDNEISKFKNEKERAIERASAKARERNAFLNKTRICREIYIKRCAAT